MGKALSKFLLPMKAFRDSVVLGEPPFNIFSTVVTTLCQDKADSVSLVKAVMIFCGASLSMVPMLLPISGFSIS